MHASDAQDGQAKAREHAAGRFVDGALLGGFVSVALGVCVHLARAYLRFRGWRWMQQDNMSWQVLCTLVVSVSLLVGLPVLYGHRKRAIKMTQPGAIDDTLAGCILGVALGVGAYLVVGLLWHR